MTDEDDVKEAVVEQLNEDVSITLKRHELIRLGQIMSERLGRTPKEQYAYEYSIWGRIVNGERLKSIIDTCEELFDEADKRAWADGIRGAISMLENHQYSMAIGQLSKVLEELEGE